MWWWLRSDAGWVVARSQAAPAIRARSADNSFARCLIASPEVAEGRKLMSETDKLFAGSIPENYDRYMVPLIFEPFAADLAQRAASLSPSAVLENAAGTGVVTRALAPKLSPGASYIVTDLNQPMLDC